MISSISGYRLSPQQAGYYQRPAEASYTSDEAAPEASQQDSAVKAVEAKFKDVKKTGQLSESDLQVLNELKQRDTEVRAHEAAHLAAAGGIATSGSSFEYQQGPDGIQYAIGGEVNIDTSPVPGDPAATLRKADTIRRAALAPAQPSGPDMQVAANAAAMAAQAQAELMQKNQDSQNGHKDHLGTHINISA